MKIVVVYESMFGNTKTVGDAITEGLRGAAVEVATGTVDDLSPDEVRNAVLIVAGGPTQARHMAKPDARRSVSKNHALDKYGPVLPGQVSLRDWLDRMPTGRAKVATFDTRFDKPTLLTGSAAKDIASLLKAKGYQVSATKSFFVRTTGGPLADGERERAVAWGRELAIDAQKSIAA